MKEQPDSLDGPLLYIRALDRKVYFSLDFCLGDIQQLRLSHASSGHFERDDPDGGHLLRYFSPAQTPRAFINTILTVLLETPRHVI